MFEKLSSLEPANAWLSVYAPKIKERLSGDLSKVDLSDQDVLAMQMVSCGTLLILNELMMSLPLFSFP
jgi:acid phosphatase